MSYVLVSKFCTLTKLSTADVQVYVSSTINIECQVHFVDNPSYPSKLLQVKLPSGLVIA
jgi:hypothetical protein